MKTEFTPAGVIAIIALGAINKKAAAAETAEREKQEALEEAQRVIIKELILEGAEDGQLSISVAIDDALDSIGGLIDDLVEAGYAVEQSNDYDGQVYLTIEIPNVASHTEATQ